ncbi:hypothetical protein DERP_014508 [Dermatophagoides pteronyssinus]|uniref:histidine--tRNA ligase n=1 Tax=Dermatophagoides pteronyssinus TaxID=6956 RepID=A0ABQ8JTJ0_DERPT|nr:hypothetical protein DERP_014508 [Dermatophagoides pteronyssinus]
MAVSLGLSCIISSSLSLVIMAAMQIFRSQLIETKLLTLFAGYLGSLIFIFILTAVNNLQMSLFGKHYQSKYTEVIFSLIVAMFTSGLVHQVAVTINHHPLVYSERTIFQHQQRSLLLNSFIRMADNKTAIEEQIKQQGDLVRSLKSQKADKEKIDLEVSKLLALKARLSPASPPSDKHRSSPTKKDDKKDSKKFTLKTPKGMRDFESKQMLVREKVFKIITDIFKRHGGLAIDTPVCERKDSFLIKINHRCILDGLFEICGVPEDKFRTICSSVDKLDKNTWEEVKEEMIKEKGLSEMVADRIGEFVKMNGSIELVEQLISNEEFIRNKRATKGLMEIKTLFDYCRIFEIESSISFDLSLARGLDYYTGLIYEVIITDKNIECGSIAAGGRYDNLVGMLAETNNWEVPCVGLSIGIERILTIIEERMSNDNQIGVGSPTQVLVASIGNELLEERMKILLELWQANINAEHIYKKSIKILNNYQYCETNRIPYAVILAEDELKRGMVKIRNIQTRKEVEIERSNLLVELKKLFDN